MTRPNLRSKRKSDDAKGNDETDIQSASNKRKVSSPASEKNLTKTNMAKSNMRSSSRTSTQEQQVMSPSAASAGDTWSVDIPSSTLSASTKDGEKTESTGLPNPTLSADKLIGKKPDSVKIPSSTLPSKNNDVENPESVEIQSSMLPSQNNDVENPESVEITSSPLSTKNKNGEKPESVEIPSSTLPTKENDGETPKSVEIPSSPLSTKNKNGEKLKSVEIPSSTLPTKENDGEIPGSLDIPSSPLLTKNKIREIPESEKKTNSTLSIKNKNVEKPESEKITNSTLLTEDKVGKKTESVEIPQHSNPTACGSNNEDTEREEEFSSNKNLNAEDDDSSGSNDVDADDESYNPNVSNDEAGEDDTDDHMLLDENGEVDTLDSEDKSVLSLARQQKQNNNDDDISDTSDSNESLMAYRPDRHIDDVNEQFQRIVSGDVKKKITSLTEVCSELLVGLDFIIMLTMIEQSDSCLLCQPMVNTRRLGIKQIEDERFINAMIGESGDIAEDMHAILYEVTDEESNETVPIYPTYVTDENSIDLRPLKGKYAKYPTRESLLQMAKELGLTDIDTTALDLVGEIFTHLSRGRSSDIIHKSLFTQQINYGNKEMETKCSPIHITKNFITLQHNLQSKHNIRIALLNGLHRSGLALHILGNYRIKNAKPLRSQKSLYQFTENSMINTMIGFHIFQAERQTYTQSFLKMCRTYSETVTKRKYDHVELTVRSQLYDLLTNKTKRDLLDKYKIPISIITAGEALLSFQEERFKVFQHNYKTLLDNFPIKKEYMSWRNSSFYPNITAADEIYKQTINYLEELTPARKIHLGRAHKTGGTKICRAPSNLLAILWLLQYSIYDENTLQYMIKFFATDTFKNNSKFVKPDWIRQFILNPVIDVIDLLSDNKSDFYIAAESYIRSRKHQGAKFTDFVTYTLTTTLIQVLLKFGDNPLFRTKNDNTIAINKFLRDNIKTLGQGENKTNDITYHCTTLYELFFTALPALFEGNAKQHSNIIFNNFFPANDLGTSFFHKHCNITDFTLQLPMKDQGEIKSVILSDYFQGILDGKVSIQDLLCKSTSQADEETKKHQKRSESDNTQKKGGKQGATKETEKAKKPRAVTEKVTVVIDEEHFKETKETVSEQIIEIMTMLTNQEDRKKDIITALKCIEVKTNDLFRKFEDAYKKKKK